VFFFFFLFSVLGLQWLFGYALPSFFCGFSFFGFYSQRTMPFHPLIAGIMVAAGGWTVEGDEQCLETTPFLCLMVIFILALEVLKVL